MPLQSGSDPATIENNILINESAALEGDCMKQALVAVGLDVLVLAKQLKTIIKHKSRPGIVVKGLDIAFKLRGDYDQAVVDNRPININIPWGGENKALTTDAIKQALLKMTPGEQQQLIKELVEESH